MKKKRCCKDVLNKNNLSFPKFVVGNLPLSMLLLKEEKQPCFNGKVEDPRQKPSGMTTNFNGFTLIELLVVVLIIGILAAVAVPQYQKAVEKSKGTQALTLLKTIGEAANVYYLTNGTWPTKFEELDVDIPTNWTGKEKIYSHATTDARSNGEWSIIMGNEKNWEQIIIGRLDGKYEGAGFAWYFKPPTSVDVQRSQKIRCLEIRAKFKLADGAYCHNLFRATPINFEEGAARLYTMP